MSGRPPRAKDQRRADTLAKLSAPAADVWVATADVDTAGRVSSYLVPLSLAWVDERVVLATEVGSAMARNIISHGRARLGLGLTRDVVMIDAELEQVYGLDAATVASAGPVALVNAFTASRRGLCRQLPGQRS